MSDIADILDRAADLITPEGAWRQGSYSNARDPLSDLASCWCVLGAIRRAGAYRSDYNPAMYAFGNFIGSTWVDAWNDAPNRTQAEVVAKLREAASRARAQQEG